MMSGVGLARDEGAPVIGMVAGEPSGDLIAARVLAGLQHQVPNLRCQGIGGPRLQAQGQEIWHPMHALTVFGYVDALKRLPSLLRTYGDVKRRWLAQPPGVFVGIDAPDFNLKLELALRQAGIPTVHFVGPSIWAWRYERIHKIREAVSHMLVLFPFEEELYRKEGVPVTYVGHPLASNIPMQPDRAAARQRLGLSGNERILAILPGSRRSEIELMAPRFLQAAQRLCRDEPGLVCLVPMVNAERKAQFEAVLQQYPVPGLRCITQEDVAPSGQDSDSWPVAWHVMEACDTALVTSGTATLETALFKRPMVISYVLSPWMRRLMSWKSGQQRPYVPWVGLPNVLLRDFAVPELLQDDATPEKLAQAVRFQWDDAAGTARIETRFSELHSVLRQDTARLAADAILETAEHGAG